MPAMPAKPPVSLRASCLCLKSLKGTIALHEILQAFSAHKSLPRNKADTAEPLSEEPEEGQQPRGFQQIIPVVLLSGQRKYAIGIATTLLKMRNIDYAKSVHGNAQNELDKTPPMD